MYPFADDMALVCSAVAGRELKTKLEGDLGRVVGWLGANGLFLNVVKSRVVFYAYKVVYDWRFRLILHADDGCDGDGACSSLEIKSAS